VNGVANVLAVSEPFANRRNVVDTNRGLTSKYHRKS